MRASILFLVLLIGCSGDLPTSPIESPVEGSRESPVEGSPLAMSLSRQSRQSPHLSIANTPLYQGDDLVATITGLPDNAESIDTRWSGMRTVAAKIEGDSYWSTQPEGIGDPPNRYTFTGRDAVTRTIATNKPGVYLLSISASYRVNGQRQFLRLRQEIRVCPCVSVEGGIHFALLTPRYGGVREIGSPGRGPGLSADTRGI